MARDNPHCDWNNSESQPTPDVDGGAFSADLFGRLLQADNGLPEPDPAFLDQLRAELIARHPQNQPTPDRRRVGIVAAPIWSPPRPFPRPAFAIVAASAALLLALFAFNSGWGNEARHAFGVPTVGASATVDLASPTPTATPVRPHMEGSDGAPAT